MHLSKADRDMRDLLPYYHGLVDLGHKVLSCASAMQRGVEESVLPAKHASRKDVQARLYPPLSDLVGPSLSENRSGLSYPRAPSGPPRYPRS